MSSAKDFFAAIAGVVALVDDDDVVVYSLQQITFAYSLSLLIQLPASSRDRSIARLLAQVSQTPGPGSFGLTLCHATRLADRLSFARVCVCVSQCELIDSSKRPISDNYRVRAH